MAKSVDAADLKSVSRRECGFKSRRPHPLLTTATTLGLMACSPAPASDILSVGVIGSSLSLDARSAPAAVLKRATAQGLTRWDDAGLVTPGVAGRWIVLDDGLTIIARLAEARWSDGRAIDAAATARSLTRLLDQDKGGVAVRIAGLALNRITAVTPDVLELRLDHQRPDLLALLAQPDFALMRASGGAGPLRASPDPAGGLRLSRDIDGDDGTKAVAHIRGERAALAIARYLRGQTDVVLGGGYADLPLAIAAQAQPLVIDPTEGVFGLAVLRRRGLLATAEGREALAMAIDRRALIGAFRAPEWATAVTFAEGEGVSPNPPAWSALPLAQRLALARTRALAARTEPSQSVRLSLAPLEGPGGRLLFAMLRSQLARAGIALDPAPVASADLRLIDRVAPSADPASSLELVECGRPIPCGPALLFALEVMERQITPAGWRYWRAEADAAMRVDLPVIPIARPLRWSLVRDGVPGFTPNARAIHPLTAMIRAASPGDS